MTLLLAVLAGVGIVALLGTVASTMAGLLTIDALNGRLGRLVLDGLLGTTLEKVLVLGL
jgi:hypothetical protein